MSKHTPGPWDNQGIYVVTEATGDIIAKCEYSKAEGRDTRANARLIAAAPELYRELKALVVALEPALNAGEVNVPGLATLNAAWLAIAKAEGR